MQSKTQDTTHRHLAPYEKLFQSPRGYVEQLQSEGPKAWLGALGIASAGYGLFGLSIALSPHGNLGISAIWMLPLTFLIAQLVSLPALYIFHAFLGSRLSPQQVAATGMIALLVPALLLAGLAPINWFLLASVKQPGHLIWLQQVVVLSIAILGYIELFNTLPEVETPKVQVGKGIAKQTKRASSTALAANRRRQLLLVWVFLYVGVLYKVMKLLTQTHG